VAKASFSFTSPYIIGANYIKALHADSSKPKFWGAYYIKKELTKS